MQNNSEIEYCYAYLDNCIKGGMLPEEKWNHILLFTRETDGGTHFEVYVNDECVGRLNLFPWDLVPSKDIIARFKRYFKKSYFQI